MKSILSLFLALLALPACVSFTRDGRPITSWGGSDGGQGAATDSRGSPYGSLWITYYWLVEQRDYPGEEEVVLHDKACREIVKTSAAFSDAICVEGSGRLLDGRVLNYGSTCACGRPCPNGGKVCYQELPRERFPWGQGSRENPLIPLRSIATDPRLIPYGTLVYVPEFDGAVIPSDEELGGFVHDGCFRADDVGTSIEGTHIDIFAGSEMVWQSLEKIVATHEDVSLFVDAPRCQATFAAPGR